MNMAPDAPTNSESLLCHTVHVHVANNTQNILFSDCTKMMCVTALRNYLHFVGPNIIFYGSTNRLSRSSYSTNVIV